MQICSKDFLIIFSIFMFESFTNTFVNTHFLTYYMCSENTCKRCIFSIIELESYLGSKSVYYLSLFCIIMKLKHKVFKKYVPIIKILLLLLIVQFSSVQFSHSVVSDSLRPHELQQARPPCPSPTPGVYSNSCPSSQWCHPAISFSVIPFSSCPQSLPASGSFPMSQLFSWSGQSTGVSASASVLPMNTQHWSPSGWTGWISLQSKGLSRVFSNTTVQKHQFFGTQLSS